MKGLSRQVLTLVSCALPVLCSANDTAYQLLAAEQLRNIRVYDRLVERTQERIAFSPDGRFHIGGMFYVLPLPYEEAVLMFRGASARTFGEKNFVEQKTEVFPREQPQELQPPGHQQIMAEWSAQLRQLGLSSDLWFFESIIQTMPYNEEANSDDRSVLYLRIADARPLFGHNCALLALGRVDHTREWLRGFHLGIPLPMKGESVVGLMTETELEFIRGVEDRGHFEVAPPLARGGRVDGGSGPFVLPEVLEYLKPVVETVCVK